MAANDPAHPDWIRVRRGDRAFDREAYSMLASVPITRRRAILTAACGTLAARCAWAESGDPKTVVEDVGVDASPVKVTKYMAAGTGRRPTVLLLHGSKGLDAHIEAYDRYARDLAGANIDTLLFTYMQPQELAAINQARGAPAREAQYTRSIARWVTLIRTLAESARKDERSTGHVGLLGFSLGGFVAIAAASEPMFDILTVFYAGLPTFYAHFIKSLPPLLDIHGDADRSVPLAQGMKLVEAAKRLGGIADLTVFQNEGHGFDLDLANRDAAAARRRAVAFTAHWLGQT